MSTNDLKNKVTENILQHVVVKWCGKMKNYDQKDILIVFYSVSFVCYILILFDTLVINMDHTKGTKMINVTLCSKLVVFNLPIKTSLSLEKCSLDMTSP